MKHRLILILAVLAAYANSIRCGLPFDSVVVVREDPRVQSWTWANLQAVFSQGYWGHHIQAGLYRPVVTLSYLFQAGDPDWCFHAVNLLLHLLATLLAYELLRAVLSKSCGGLGVRCGSDVRAASVALWATLLWAVHPVNTEAVTNVAGRCDLLAACGVLGGLVLYRMARSVSVVDRRWGVLVSLFLVSLAAVFSKESGAVILPLALLMDWWLMPPRVDCQYGGTLYCWVCNRLRLPNIPALVAISAPIALMVWARWFLRLDVGRYISPLDNPIVAADWVTAKLTAFKVLGKLLWVWIYPAVLHSDYSFSAVTLVQNANYWICFLPAVLICCWVVLAAISFKYGWRWLLLPLAVFVCFLPSSNLIIPAGTIMAERFLYLPGLGLSVIVAWGVIWIFAVHQGIPRYAQLVLATFCLLAYARTVRRNMDYRDDVVFWSAAAEASPHSFKPHSQIASLAYQRNLLDLAKSEADHVVEILSVLPPEQDNFTVWSELFPYYRAVFDDVKMKLVADRVALLFNSYQEHRK